MCLRFNNRMHDKTVGAAAVAGGAGGKGQYLAAAGHVHAGIVQRGGFQLLHKGIVLRPGLPVGVIQLFAVHCRVAGEDAAGFVPCRCAEGKGGVLLPETFVFVLGQFAEHGTGVHVVAIEYAVQRGIAALGCGKKQAAVGVGGAVKAEMQISLVVLGLHHRQ